MMNIIQQVFFFFYWFHNFQCETSHTGTLNVPDYADLLEEAKFLIPSLK